TRHHKPSETHFSLSPKKETLTVRKGSTNQRPIFHGDRIVRAMGGSTHGGMQALTMAYKAYKASPSIRDPFFTQSKKRKH
ncbi:hypothetical protein GIB67_024291, partial [Kingdonia uniflora]